MSLPPATKDISENPQAGSVTSPVDKVQKDADVDRKLRLYGVIEAFRRGRMPDNKQIDETLTYVREHSFVDVKKLSPDGQKLIQDVRDIVETARVIAAEKNADELFQNFLWHTKRADYSAAKQDPNDIVPVSGQQVQQDKEQATQHLRTLLSLVLTNSEARKLFADFAYIGRDVLATGAVKSAELIRPDQERLQNVDKPAPENQFISKDGKQIGPNETPVPEVRVPGTDTRIAQHPREDLGYGAEITTGDGNTMRGHEVQSQAQQQLDSTIGETQNRYPEYKQNAIDQAQAHKEDIQRDVDSAPEDQKADVAKTGFKEKMQGFRDGLLDRIPQQHKDTAQDHYDRGKDYLLNEIFPEDRRDQFIYRGKKVIVECQRHDDYQASIRWLLGLLETYSGHAQAAASAGSNSHGTLTEDPSLQQAFSELRILLERFANGQSLDPVMNALNDLYRDANEDEGLRNWFKEVDAYARKVLLEPGYVLEPKCNDDGARIRDSGRRFYDEKYRDQFNNLFNNIGAWFGAMGEDPLNVRFGEDWGRLTKDLLFDSDGDLTFKPQLWADIRQVILPAIIDQAGYIPIPRVEYTDEGLDLVLENLTLQGRNLFPNIITLEAHNFFKFSPYNTIPDAGSHEFTFTLAQMQADMRDIAFYFHRKTGAIKLRDSGIADVILGGSGLTATVHLSSAGKDTSSVFKVKHVNVKVDTLKFSIRDSKHETLYKIVKPLATGLVKKQIQKALEGAIQTALEYVDGQLVTVRDRMEEAKRTEGMSRTEALQDLFNRKKAETTSSKSTNSQFKVVSKRESVIMQDKGHPSGLVNRQAELQNAAGDGKEWRSKAFTIVNSPAQI